MNLRRVLAVLLAMMLSAYAASAQMVKASFGVTGGGIATMMSGTEPATSTPLYINGDGGAFTTINIGNSLGIRGGANYAMQGSSYMLSGTELTAAQSYIQVPVSLLWHMRSFISLEAGFYQNILFSSSLTENGSSTVVINPDEGALKYNFGALAGLEFNFGRFVFLELKYHYGLSNSYVIYGEGYPSSFATVGLGFNIINTRKKAF
jgi:hypothetical protein